MYFGLLSNFNICEDSVFDTIKMCGIFFRVFFKLHPNACHLKEDKKLLNLLTCRGPDLNDSIFMRYCSDLDVWKFFSCLSSDIPLQSDSNVPFTVEMNGNTLWMQGSSPTLQPAKSEFGVLLFNGDIFNNDWNNGKSDTEELLHLLNPESIPDKNSDSVYIVNVLKSLIGPFSLIYLDMLNNKLYFCRDRLGRHSLLLHKTKNEFIISSVLGRNYNGALELPANSIFCYNLNDSKVVEFPWEQSHTNELFLDDWFHLQQNSNQTYQLITTLMAEKDLIYVEKIESLAESDACPIDIFGNILNDKDIQHNVDCLLKHLSDSVKVRVNTQPGFCLQCIGKISKCERHCTVGVLFSGGLDCTILAALVHQHVPLDQTIDLLNVAFQRTNCNNYDVPDRLTAKQSLEELKYLFPQRKWNLSEINITTEELLEKQKEIIGDLVFPLQSILDESLGSALWFAARGVTPSYTSTCRVLVMGMGADELFGGYTRHRNAFKRGGWLGLEKELQIDWQRISTRNLARDDRVVSHHGRQPRMPYLDECFVDYTLKLKPWEKCIPSNKLGPGIGDKMILRLAAFKLGLKSTSTLPKRAIQFGSRIANKKENASDISVRLLGTCLSQQ